MTYPPADLWRAGTEDLDLLVPLFDAYRQFYKLPSDLELCRDYLTARLERGEAVVFLAGTRGTQGLGFTLLYPTFASLHAKAIFVLYDLFVTPAGRGKGLGRQLMNRARKHAEEAGAAAIVLSTAHSNIIGQTLYESLGYKQDTEFLTYELMLE
jgi:ribosomal protein S18 acetylase RimI-like enzyme